MGSRPFLLKRKISTCQPWDTPVILLPPDSKIHQSRYSLRFPISEYTGRVPQGVPRLLLWVKGGRAGLGARGCKATVTRQ